jgi:hypothetical protein
MPHANTYRKNSCYFQDRDEKDWDDNYSFCIRHRHSHLECSGLVLHEANQQAAAHKELLQTGNFQFLDRFYISICKKVGSGIQNVPPGPRRIFFIQHEKILVIASVHNLA